MRFAFVAAACLSLLAVPHARSTAMPGTATASPAATDAAAAGAGTPAAAPPPSDAAAKHARRTACLKDAKAKKLMGADKSAFLKTCIASP